LLGGELLSFLEASEVVLDKEGSVEFANCHVVFIFFLFIEYLN